jgi:8-oxo-dGTP diphosphatase
MHVSTLCYLKKDGKTLMMHRIRKSGDVHQGKYNGLGGKFLPGETPEECVKREVLEESGLLLENAQMRGVMMFPKFKDNEDWLVFLFVSTRFGGEMTESHEGILEWVDDDKLLALNLWEGDKLFLKWLEEVPFFSAKFIYKDKKLADHHVTFYRSREEAGQR